ncbi:MAG: amino acid ABC transporter permease [Butyrivibrio sp.]|nr:amino acid ABC transporter permease [Butyrivibrio sp.]
MWQNLRDEFVLNFIDDNRWQYLTKGLGVTLEITLFAALLGVLLGVIVAVIRNVNQNTGKLKIANAICNLYLIIIRGTPVLVQLLILYFVIFASVRIDKTLTAIIAFGINSGAYQAEIFRAGIESVPKGQFEAGRSLGFSYGQTMMTIILPQAVKNIIPTMCNEFIALLKETSVAGYIALEDLTKGGDIIRSRTYSAFMPYIAVAAIYLVIVLVLSHVVKMIERSLKKSER